MKQIIIALLVLSFFTVFTQKVAKDSIYSNVLKEQRKTEVVLPDK